MDDIYTYQIELRGEIAAGDFNAFGPPDLTVKWEQDATTLIFRADQAGLIGLMRHLHACGFALLSMQSKVEKKD
jgi:hypothetical protein